jgi:hypothetical protein
LVELLEIEPNFLKELEEFERAFERDEVMQIQILNSKIVVNFFIN